MSINNPQPGDKVIGPGHAWKRERFISENSIQNFNRPRDEVGPREPIEIGADFDNVFERHYRSQDRAARTMGLGSYVRGYEGPLRW